MGGVLRVALQADGLIPFYIGADIGMGIMASKARERLSVRRSAGAAIERIGLESLRLSGAEAIGIHILGASMACAAEVIDTRALPTADLLHVEPGHISGSDGF